MSMKMDATVARVALTLAGVFVGLGGLAGSAPVTAQQPVTLQAYRFWRPPDNTLIEAYASIPLGLLTFEQRAGEDHAPYTASFEVKDSSGLSLTRQEWSDTISVPSMSSGRMRATTTEHFTFQVTPGRYTLELIVHDPASGRSWRAEHQVLAFEEAPRTSDLVLGGELVRLEEETEDAAAEAIVRGTLAIVPNLAGVLSMDRPTLAVYAEIYRIGATTADSAAVWIDLSGVNRAFTYKTTPQTRVYPAGLGSEAYALSLAGLPPGEYRMALNIDIEPEPLVLQHGLQMLPPGAGVMATASTMPYADATSEQLDSIFDPMRLIAARGEMETFESLTSADAKRRFIARFWEQRAAGAGMTYDGILEDWHARLDYANTHFRPQAPGQKIRAGWQTDRGRLYVKYGPPNERYTSGQTDTQEIKACEAWQYTGGRGDRYIFWDRSGFGDFELVFSTDRDEPGIPGTEQIYPRTGILRCEPTRPTGRGNPGS